MVRVSVLQLVDLNSILLLSDTNELKMASTASVRDAHPETDWVQKKPASQLVMSLDTPLNGLTPSQYNVQVEAQNSLSVMIA